MRFMLLFAILGSVVFETHQVAGQTESKIADLQKKNPALETNDKKPAQPKPAAEPPKPRFNIPLKTAGGTQVWTDYVYRDGYRIQENSFTGHFRLLDADNVRRAWGTREQCQVVLDNESPEKPKPAKPPKIAVLLHGLMRTANSMKPVEKELTAAGIDQCIRFSYASSRRSMGQNAAALSDVLAAQHPNAQFCFVGHSMGNIVVRHLIGDLKRNGDPSRILPRCTAMVMLGPPNQGASIARRLAPTGLYGLVTGKGGIELGPEWDEFVAKLATPPFPFAIVAGDLSANMIQNPLVDGASDFVVSLEEAKLEGSEAFHTVPVLHSFLMSDAKAVELTTDFVRKHALQAE